jgi:ankyrin repeat protein
MPDFRSMARDPNFRRRFEKLLYLAALRGDDDLVAERLSWGIDPNCASASGTTPLIANVRGSSPNAATVRALLKAGANPSQTDHVSLTALDYARRKLARLQARGMPRPRKSPSLDENNQLRLSPKEEADFDELRREAGDDIEYLRMCWLERLLAARRVFNDPAQVAQIVAVLEAADEQP